jgi:hypothetical protein
MGRSRDELQPRGASARDESASVCAVEVLKPADGTRRVASGSALSSVAQGGLHGVLQREAARRSSSCERAERVV